MRTKKRCVVFLDIFHMKIMGILNVTPDSLFGGMIRDGGDGGFDARLEGVARQMVNDGADIIDVGGESTGPGSKDVSVDDEWSRVERALKVLVKLREEGLKFEISVDTYKADVFERALLYGVDILNDITALRGDDRMIEVVAGADVKVCMMYAAVGLHAEGNDVRTNTEVLNYDDVIRTIGDFLQERIEYASHNGVSRDRIILDPGMGAFISGDHRYSFEVLDRLLELKERFSDLPILIGASRKGFTGLVFDENGEVIDKLPVVDRLQGSLDAAKIAVQNGADILRVHDVRETKRLFR